MYINSRIDRFLVQFDCQSVFLVSSLPYAMHICSIRLFKSVFLLSLTAQFKMHDSKKIGYIDKKSEKQIAKNGKEREKDPNLFLNSIWNFKF